MGAILRAHLLHSEPDVWFVFGVRLYEVGEEGRERKTNGGSERGIGRERLNEERGRKDREKEIVRGRNEKDGEGERGRAMESLRVGRQGG